MFVLASNHFQKCFLVNAVVWLHIENKFSRKYFQLTVCFNGFDLEICFSQNFHFKPFMDSHVERERERAQITPLTSLANPEPRSNLRLHQSTNPRTDLWHRAFNPLIYEPMNRSSTHEPSTLSATQSLHATNPQTNLSLSLWFWFFVWFWSTHETIYVSVWFLFFTFSLWYQIFLLLLWWCGWWCFGGFPIVWWW